MALDGVVHRAHPPQLAEAGAAEVPVGGDLKELVVLLLVEKGTVGSEKLVGVPRRRVMTGGDGDAAGGGEFFHHEPDRRRRSEADVVHVAAGRLETREREMAHHMPGKTAVAAQHDVSAVGESREGQNVAEEGFRNQGVADDAADAGNADHGLLGHNSTGVRLAGLPVKGNRSGNSDKMDRHAVAELRLEPRGFRRHQPVLIGDLHEVVDGGGEQG